MNTIDCCCVILREERPKDLKVTGMLSLIVVWATRDNCEGFSLWQSLGSEIATLRSRWQAEKYFQYFWYRRQVVWVLAMIL